MTKSVEDETIGKIHDYAWNWFSYHASQRMTVFRLFFVVIGVIAVGYYQTLEKNPNLAATFAALGIASSVLFWRLDLRTRELIKISEDLLLETEKKLDSEKIVSVRLIQDAGGKNSKHATKFWPSTLYSYGQIFSAIFWLASLTMTFALLCAAIQAGWLASACRFFSASVK